MSNVTLHAEQRELQRVIAGLLADGWDEQHVIHELLQRAGALERNGQHALAMLVEAECVTFNLEMPE